MLTLTIPDVPDEVAEGLRRRAIRRGRTLEAEVRAVLDEVSRDDGRVGAGQAWIETIRAAQAAFEPLRDPGSSIVDELLADRRRAARRDEAASRPVDHGGE